MARILGLRPLSFVPLGLAPDITLALRLVASFCGVFGFSIMFNSPAKLAATAGLFGAVANTLRLGLVDLAGFPASGAAFLGALTAGLLASAYKKHTGYPRIAQTVPSIVIMVPGLYLYRGHLPPGRHGTGPVGVLVCVGRDDHHGPAPGTDCRPDFDGQEFPVQFVKNQRCEFFTALVFLTAAAAGGRNRSGCPAVRWPGVPPDSWAAAGP